MTLPGCEDALRPTIRIPLALAAAIPAAAYVLRSIVRGSAAPDLPGDAVVLVVVALALIFGARYGSAAERRRSELADEMQEHDDPAAERRERHEV